MSNETIILQDPAGRPWSIKLKETTGVDLRMEGWCNGGAEKNQARKKKNSVWSLKKDHPFSRSLLVTSPSNCIKNSYHSLQPNNKPRIPSMQDDAIRNLFSAKTIHEYSAQSLLTFLVMFYTLAVVTFGTAVPAGQFVPGIMIGSTYGRLVGMFVVSFYKKLNIEEGTYALLGAASFLGGSMRMTVSLCVIMVEITNNLKLLPLIMLVLLISKAIGDAFNEGLYEEQSRLRNIPQLESKPKYQMRKMTAKEACGKRVISFPRVVKVADLVSILRSNIHNGFPVIDHSRNGETFVIGLLLRSHLLVLLQSKVDFHKDVKVDVLLDDYCEAVVRDF